MGLVIKDEQKDHGRTMLGAALAVLSRARPSGSGSCYLRLPRAPRPNRSEVPSCLRQSWSLWVGDAERSQSRQRSWWGDTGSRSLLGKAVSELISGRGERKLIVLHWQVMFLGFSLIVLVKVMTGCSSDYLSLKPHGNFVG